MFYDTLKLICKARGTTVTSVVSQIGMSKGAIGNWKKGSVPTGDKIALLAEVLSVSTDYLLGIQAPNLSPNQQKLIDLANTLSDDKINTLLTMADTWHD